MKEAVANMVVSCIALVPAAGIGRRMDEKLPKQYQCTAGKPLLFYTLLALSKVPEITQLAVVLAPCDAYFDQFDWSIFKSLLVLRVGGESRFQSVKLGVAALHQQYPIRSQDWLLVHDGVRCCIRPDQVTYFIQTLQEDEVGGVMAIPVLDTLKKTNAESKIIQTVERSNLWLAQTPQMFRAHLLMRALEQEIEATDEASAVECLGYQPTLVKGATNNIKVTYPADLALATVFLASSEDLT